MFRDVVAVEAAPIILLQQAQPIGVETIQRDCAAIHVVEYAELHRILRSALRRACRKHGAGSSLVVPDGCLDGQAWARFWRHLMYVWAVSCASQCGGL